MHEVFGAEFQCKNNPKHKMRLYFFDSQPTEHRCQSCDDGSMMDRIRIIDMKKTPSVEGMKKFRNAQKTHL